jgi:hypothetical protein
MEPWPGNRWPLRIHAAQDIENRGFLCKYGGMTEVVVEDESCPARY